MILIPLLCVPVLVCIPASAQDIEHPVKLPASFHYGLIFVEPVTEDGDTLRLFTDSADATLMYENTVERHGLTTTSAIIQDRQQQAAFLPPFVPDRFIPAPLITDGLIPVRADNRKPPHHQVILRNGDGILGSTWFASRAWTINYRKETFYVTPTGDEIPESGDTEYSISPGESARSHVPLSFREQDGRRIYHFARLQITVGGDSLSMVLKTGSNIILDDEARQQLDHPDALLPVGLITESVFEQWRSEHPDWPVYRGADSNYGSDVIEVPKVQIGSHISGPVRFAVRRDMAFDEWFSEFTDEPVQGALGPNAFQNVHLTIDYPNAVLIFHE